jgi:hypothetical protein
MFKKYLNYKHLLGLYYKHVMGPIHREAILAGTNKELDVH